MFSVIPVAPLLQASLVWSEDHSLKLSWDLCQN